MAADGEDLEEDVQDDSAHSFDGHTDAVFSIAWNPAVQGSVATGGGDDRAFLWRAGTADGTVELGQIARLNAKGARAQEVLRDDELLELLKS